MTTPLIFTPSDDYALLDFGAGRRLERFGTVTVDRPDPRAAGVSRYADWSAHWRFDARLETWQRGDGEAPAGWRMAFEGEALELALGPGGELGWRPEQYACRRWLADRLATEAREPLRVLNLFGAPDGVSALAARLGARVTHVGVEEAALVFGRERAGAGGGVDWLLQDPADFIEHALQRQQRYDLILLDPPGFMHTPHGHVWDIQRDLARLIRNIARLASTAIRGVWVSLYTRDVNAESIARLLAEAFPGRPVQAADIALADATGRALTVGAAVHWAEDTAALTAGAVRAPLTAAQVEEHLDVHLDAVLSSRRTAAEPARGLAALSRTQQAFVLGWVESIAQSNAEMAYQFAAFAPRAFALMEQDDVERWLLEAMDVFDRTGLHQALGVLKEVEAFARAARARAAGVALEEIAGVLGLFVQGLSGRTLKIEAAECVHTDSETLFLPTMLCALPGREDNFRLYKALAVQLWAQTRFGTFRAPPGADSLAEALQRYDDPARAAALFLALETLRLDACLARELPGMHRQIDALREQLGEPLTPPGWGEYAATLAKPGASSADSHALLARIYPAVPPPPGALQGQLLPQAVAAVTAARLAREKDRFRRLLAEWPGKPEQTAPAPQRLAGAAERFSLARIPDADQPEGLRIQLQLDGIPVQPPEEVQAVMSSILQDLGDIPDEYLVPAGAGPYRLPNEERAERSAEDVWKGTYHEEGAFLYNEWDFKRRHYRKNWCVLREVAVHPGSSAFIERTRSKYAGLIKQLRRSFEALRGEDKLLKKQPHGDDIDLDALVEGIADVHAGMEMSERLFTKKHKLERDIAVMFMVDMSGSTKGWINDAEREALVLLCEALQSLGDRYAVYGFSGMTRKKCELFPIKRFDEPYDDTVRGRIAGIAPHDYTRMGVIIRHLTKLLNEVEARTRLLVTLSDGKPDDFDGYRGEYGVEDTRQALIEAKQQGVHPYCITIDEEARDYLPHMYGAVNYTVIDDVAKLPLKVSDIYRRLTS